jgi:hypothetical protein
LRPDLDALESRTLLSTVPFVAHPLFALQPMGNGMNPQSSAPYTPAQISQAYQFNSISFNGVAGNGRGETIAIVDAYDDPNIQTDLNTFDTNFSLPATTVIRVNQNGGTAYPGTDPAGDWEVEESLDVEWAHALAPQATIMLVEAFSANGNDLLAAVAFAAAHANVISMSWGGGEWSGETTYDSSFAQPGVAYVASSGDSGAPAGWPAVSSNVLSVGGTALFLGSGGTWSSESGWSGSGGGPSAYEGQPSYQKGVVTQTSNWRATPDVAYDASPSTGVYVYDSFPFGGGVYGWLSVGGTSAGSPQWSALLAIADQGRAIYREPALNATSPQEVMNILYKNPADFHDITTGSSLGSPSYSARAGYDYVTGMGSPIAYLIAGSLATAPPPRSPAPTNDQLILTGPTSATAGSSFNLTVTAETSGGATDAGYLGTIHFASSDSQAGLPANYTFVATDHGTHTFSITLKSAGFQTITATDTSNSSVTGTLQGINVRPAALNRLMVSGLPFTATPTVPLRFTVTAADPYGNVETGYTGTVHFTSSDPAASLPANYTFTTANGGMGSFSVAFNTSGTQSVTVTDLNSGITGSQSGVYVGLAAPSNLTAVAVSSSQINLSWTGSRGATGYVIQESLNSGGGWSQIGTTSANTTTFQDTGLVTGMTFYFRVYAIVSSFNSGYSNIASATTGAAKARGNTIWSNSYVPNENTTAFGSYEVGVKFESNVGGKVTGVRFYKQAVMGGYVHVGHLWSSTGQLLATATFTNETASGWQEVGFSSPVSIQPFTVYIASFSTGGGYFGITTGFFSTGGVTSYPLQALGNGAPGGNGVYNAAGSFPNVSGNGMNFWADVDFTPSYGGIILNALARPAAAPGSVRLEITAVHTHAPTRSRREAHTAKRAETAPHVVSGTRVVQPVLSFWSSGSAMPKTATPASFLKSTRAVARPTE